MYDELHAGDLLLGIQESWVLFSLHCELLSFLSLLFQIPPLQTAEVTVHLFNQQTLTGHILGVRVSVRLSR